MKLVSVKILGKPFRSLASEKLYKFKYAFRSDKLSTKVFAGLNGSGKSNFLELFSEIFYYLEIYRLNPKDKALEKAFDFELEGFEIEYFLPMVQTSKLGVLDFDNAIEYDMHVRIIKPKGEFPEFSRKKSNQKDFERIDRSFESLLPTKVIAYTSGQNELLSNPYNKLKYHYFKEFEKAKKQDNDEEIDFSESHRLFFLDYSSNFSIFVSNMLLADEAKLKILKDAVKIKDLESFRITINTHDLYEKVIPFNKPIEKNIEKLKLCASTWIVKKVGTHSLLILDFLVTAETKKVFKSHFGSSFNLFQIFYELEIFNLFLVKSTSRELIRKSRKEDNISDEMPKPDPARLVFRIEKIVIDKIIDNNKPATGISYKSLSDGEHQFNEVFGTVLMMQQEGCLFLIDEPDTHFNPKWRAKFINMLNQMAATSFDSKGNILKVTNQEIVITTHSPLVISDSQSDDVYKFDKLNGIVDYTHSQINVYGASVSIILDEIFGKEEGISEMAQHELKHIADNITTIDELRNVVTRLNSDFGDSVEKFDLFGKLRNLKKELE